MTTDNDTDRAPNSPAHRSEREHSAPSSPHDEKIGGGPKTAKDRACPFCGLAFTSSSLGRHLDLYIKPKNPKPPDGIHDVAEIKKLRAGITRRQPRASGRHDNGESTEPTWHREARDSGTPVAPEKQIVNSSQDAPVSIAIPPHVSPVASPILRYETNPAGVRMHSASWQATGVINDLPPRSANAEQGRPTQVAPTQARRMQEMRRDGAGQRVERPEYETEGMRKLEEQAEVGKAAELALRELLGSFQAARKKAQPRELFPGLDFLSMSFPALCLAILPPPPTIFSPTPFESLESWSLEPPGRKQFDNLQRAFTDQVKLRQKNGVAQFPDSIVFHHSAHLNSALEHWAGLSDKDRHSVWLLELCRSFAKSRERGSQLEARLDQAESRVRHLEAEYDRLSRCQLPREYLLRPPQTIPIASNLAQGISSGSKDMVEADYDIDLLLDRWRGKVRTTARKTTQLTPYRPPAFSQSDSQSSSTYHKPHIRDDLIVNGSVFGVNGAFPRDGTLMNSSGNGHETPPLPGGIVGEEDDGARSEPTPRMSSAMKDEDLRQISRGGALARLVRPDIEHASRINGNGKRARTDAS